MTRSIKKTFLASIFAILLSTICILCLPTIAFAAEDITPVAEEATVLYSGACGTNLTWEIDDAGTLSIDGTGDMSSYSYGSAPWYVYRSNITKIIVSDEITSISNGAFYGLSAVKEMSIPFVGASRTATYEKAVFGYIFGYESQTAYTLGYGYIYQGMTESYISASSDYKYQTSSSKTFIDYRLGTSSTTVYNPTNTTWQYSSYTDYHSESYSPYTRYYLQSWYYYIPSSITKVTITDDSVIDAGAFLNCKNITDIHLNDEITEIDQYAFAQATSLKVFAFPDNLETLGNQIFYNCDSITDIEFPSGVTSIPQKLFYDCDGLMNVKFHANITSIGNYAFYSCSKLKNVTLPENLVTIRVSAFAGCISFTEIVIPNNVEEINSCAFEGCSNVTEVTIGTSVKTIGSSAFQNLSKVDELVVPNNVVSIGSSAFRGWNSLKELSIPFVGESRTATYEKAVFGYIFGYESQTAYTLGYGYIYQGTSGSYVGASSYQYVTSGSYAFVDYRLGTSSTLIYNPTNTTWQYSCFSDYHYFDYSPNSIYYLVSYYYYIPSSITKVTVTDDSVIDAGAFLNCKNITEIVLNDEITKIDQYAFAQATKLDVFELPSELTTLGNHAFYNCDSITDIEIPNGVTSISEQLFYDCDALVNVKFHSNITTIGSSAFYSCGKLKNVDLPENLVTINDHAFAVCVSFTEIAIPNKVENINSCAFQGCSNVTKVTIGTSVKTIGSSAFQNLSKVEELVVPNSVTSIGSSAFRGWNSLKELSIPFVGASRTATYEKAVFGYIFGYESKSAHDTGYGYIYEGTTGSYAGASSYQYKTSGSDTFANYRLGTSSTVMYNPANATWQYSCYSDYYKYDYTPYYRYFLVSYYYYIPSSITKVTITDDSVIDAGAFLNCQNITEINIESTVESVGDCAFYNTGVINNATSDFVISGNVLIAYKGSDTTVIIPEGIDVIASRAFFAKSKIGTVVLADSTHYIGAYAFYNCTSALVKVPRISGTLTIDSYGFSGTGSVEYLDKLSYTNGNDTYYYTVDGEGNAIIVGCSTISANITLPNTLGGHTVTAVGYKGMANCTTLTGVTIPNNIVKLDLYAFAGCTKLDTATIPATCVYVGQYAFSGCTSLTTVVIAEGVTYLGDYCFENCTSLTEIVVPDSCTYLGNYAFYNCVSMESATIGITVPAIGKYTFYNCEKLATAVIGISVESIGEYAFYNTALTRLTTPTTLKHIGNYAFASCDDLERVALKAGLLTIGDGAFMGDAALATINWTANINSIGAYAFHGCASLTSATIPANVTEIKDYTFAYCTSLATVTVKGTLTSIGEKAFYRDALTSFTFAEGLENIGADAFAFNNIAEVILPNSINSIGGQAFMACENLATVSMPDDVSYVGAYAFEDVADGLIITIRYNSGKIADYMLYNIPVYKVIMENGITEIGNYTFALCHDLTEITFPNTLQTIGNYAFYDNRSYSELTLPNTVTNIGNYAFARGYELVKINIPDSVLTIGEGAFYREEVGNHIDPDFTVDFYYNKGVIAANILDGQHIHHIIVDDYIHTIGDNAFSNCANLKDVILPDTIAVFGNNCFLNDNNITVNINKVDGLIDDNIYQGKLTGVETVNINNTCIGKYSFADNVELKYVTINEETDIGDYAFSNNVGLLKASVVGNSNVGNYSFYNCNSMTDFVIDGTIERIGEHAFESCKALRAMVLPTTVNYIGSYAFYDCNSMASINIPDGIEKILSHTFYGCASLGSIEVPNSVTAIEGYAFYGCIVASQITLSNQCKSIGEYAFYNCKALSELNIPESVTSIGEYAFRSCGGITELVFSDNVDTIGACAFYDCNGLETVKLGKKIIELGDKLFYGCVNLESLYVYAPLSYIDTLAFYGADFVTVYCGRDDYMINFFDENGIMYVLLDDLVYEYKITFVTDNGEIISSATYTSGSTVTPPTNPTKSADNTYTYEFIGWDQEITVVGGNKTYTASFTPVYIEYTIVFKDHNGTTLGSSTYHYGDEVTAPSNPTRAADNTYTYAFAGWDNEVVACAGDTTYTATYTPTYIEYTVEFKDFGGEILSSNAYHYGDAITVPTNPTRAADLLGTYSFKGWDKEIVNCAGNTTYTATYDITYIDYTVTFKNYDGSIISTNTYHYGDNVTVPSAPTKVADATYTYVFAGWDSDVTVCDGNKEYVATFTPEYIEYIVVFKNYDDTVISTETYHYGQSVTVPSDPTKPSDEMYSYTFAGWDKSVTACVGDATYKATYSSKYIDYTITFVDLYGNVLGTKTYHYGDTIEAIDDPANLADETYTYIFAGWQNFGTCQGNEIIAARWTSVYNEYTVIFKNYDGSIISEEIYHYNDNVVEPSDVPTKNSDTTYTYVFAGWDNDVTVCKGDTVYVATFTPVYINYTITFKNDNGTILSTKTYHYGDTITQPDTPTKASDNVYSYTFKAWDKTVVKCEGDAIYTATYTPTFIEYTVEFVDEDNTLLSTRTYHYGDTIVAPTTPTKASDNTYNYTFAGWDKAVTNCDGNATYKATYNAAFINYTVVFKNYNGDVISSKTYHYGDTVVVPSTPKKPSDENYCYVFAGWDKSVTNCYGDAVYTAKFTASDLPIVTVDSSSARASETVVVNILLSGAPNLESLAISDILYDTNAFELISVEWKVTDAILSNWDAATGKGALALSTSKDLNGTIISLTFRVKDGTADGNYPVSCTVTSHESDFKNVAGQITIYSVAPGDVDGNESLDKNDAIYLLMHSFFPEDYPINQEADYNGNGTVDKDDAIHLLMHTFFPDDYPLAPAPAAVTITTTEERKKEDEE